MMEVGSNPTGAARFEVYMKEGEGMVYSPEKGDKLRHLCRYKNCKDEAIRGRGLEKNNYCWSHINKQPLGDWFYAFKSRVLEYMS